MLHSQISCYLKLQPDSLTNLVKQSFYHPSNKSYKIVHNSHRYASSIKVKNVQFPCKSYQPISIPIINLSFCSRALVSHLLRTRYPGLKARGRRSPFIKKTPGVNACEFYTEMRNVPCILYAYIYYSYELCWESYGYSYSFSCSFSFN